MRIESQYAAGAKRFPTLCPHRPLSFGEGNFVGKILRGVVHLLFPCLRSN